MTSRRLPKSSPPLPQGQRPDPIPAWGIAQGNRRAENKRAEGPVHPARDQAHGTGLQPLVRMETVPWAVGPGWYDTAPLALRRQPQSSAMTSRRLHKSSPALPSTFTPVPLLALALADYTRTLAWVDRFPAIAKESRKPFVEKRREVHLKLGRKSEAEADERELKASVQQ